MTKLIIPISGKAQHGKDTTASILKANLEAKGHKVLIMHFADYLKYGCAKYLEWDGQKDDRGRHILQQTGTEGIRSVYPDFWVETVAKWIDGALTKSYDVFLIPDARFPNEIDYLKDFSFHVPVKVLSTRVTRLNFESPLPLAQQQHASETSLDNYQFDLHVRSHSSTEYLEMCVDSLAQFLVGTYL